MRLQHGVPPVPVVCSMALLLTPPCKGWGFFDLHRVAHLHLLCRIRQE